MNLNDLAVVTLDRPGTEEVDNDSIRPVPKRRIRQPRIPAEPRQRFSITAVYNAAAEVLVNSRRKPIVPRPVERPRQQPYAYD